MKKYVMILLLSMTTLFLIYSCSKDSVLPNDPDFEDTSVFGDPDYYNSGGELIKKAIAVGLDHPEFRKIIYEQAIKEEDGDTEFLLNDIIERPIEGKSVGKFLEQKYRDSYGDPQFSTLFLVNFLQEFPNFLMGVRGSIAGWDVDNHIPIVAFASSHFKEIDKETRNKKRRKTHQSKKKKY